MFMLKLSFLVGSMLALAMAWLQPSPIPVLTWVLRGVFYCLAWFDNVQGINAETGYMEGNWVPVTKELNRVEVIVDGSIPSHLKGGMYVRTGANPRCWPPSNIHHAFCQDAMLHRISLEGDKVYYSNSWIEEDPLGRSPGGECQPKFGAGDIYNGGLAILRMVIVGILDKLAGIPKLSVERTQAGATSVVRLGDSLYAATESFCPSRLRFLVIM